MPEDHRHCMVCGKVVDPGKFFCSPPCEEVFKLHQKRMRRARLFMMASLIAIFVLLLVFIQLSPK